MEKMSVISIQINVKVNLSKTNLIPIRDRICKLRIQGKFYNFTFISAYSSTQQAKIEGVEKF